MPIQEGEEASGRPAAKTNPILKRASTSNPNSIPMKDRKWIDTEVQKSKDQSCSKCRSSLPICFDIEKLVVKKMPEFLIIELLRNAKKNCQMIQDIGQTK